MSRSGHDRRREPDVCPVVASLAASPKRRLIVPEPRDVLDAGVAVEVLDLGAAQDRAAELLTDAALRGDSIDLSGTPGLGKSHAVTTAEIARLRAWDGRGSKPLSVIAIGGAKGLPVLRLVEVAARVTAEHLDANVLLALGRQPLQVDDADARRGDPFRLIDERTAPHGFACPELRKAASRMACGLGGCSGCRFGPRFKTKRGGDRDRDRETYGRCESTPGAFLHDWDQLVRATREKPTFLVTTHAALGTYWSRLGRHGDAVRFNVDDVDDVDGGFLGSTTISGTVARWAWTTATNGAAELRATAGNTSALVALRDSGEEQADGDTSPPTTRPADALIAARIGRVLLRGAGIGSDGHVRRRKVDGRSLRVRSRAGLGDTFERLARIGWVRSYVAGHDLSSRAARRAIDLRLPHVATERDVHGFPMETATLGRGIGVCRVLWSAFRGYLNTGSLPTIEDGGDEGVRIVTGDTRLAAVAAAGRVSRVGVVSLPRFTRAALGVRSAHAVVVPVDATVLAVRPLGNSSWGKRRSAGSVPLASRASWAMGKDAVAAFGDAAVFVGGVSDAKELRGTGTVRVQGRDDRSQNGDSGARIVTSRRLATPFDAIHAQVSALCAAFGCDRPPETPHGASVRGRAPSGAILPVDDRVRDAYLTARVSALRNGPGRARAVRRPGEVTLVVLDQDAVRWPALMLPGHAVEVVTVDEARRRLPFPTAHLDAELATIRAAHDAHPKRTAERDALVAAALDAGHRTVTAICNATVLSRAVVHRALCRLQTGRDRSGVPYRRTKGNPSREVRNEHARFRPLAELGRKDVARLAATTGKDPTTVRRWRKDAQRALAGEGLDVRTIPKLDEALQALDGRVSSEGEPEQHPPPPSAASADVAASRPGPSDVDHRRGDAATPTAYEMDGGGGDRAGPYRTRTIPDGSGRSLDASSRRRTAAHALGAPGVSDVDRQAPRAGGRSLTDDARSSDVESPSPERPGSVFALCRPTKVPSRRQISTRRSCGEPGAR